jgi:adenylate kinase
MNSPASFIFLGRSGAGKGTQVKLLEEHLKVAPEWSSLPLFRVTTGDKFRDLVMKDTYTSRLCKEVNDAGGLQPHFLAVVLWGQLLIDNLTGPTHLITDGSPRSVDEAEMFNWAVKLYKCDNRIVIHLDTPEEECRQRLLARGRVDDKDSSIARRMEWFTNDVEPVIEFYKQHTDYKLVHINGSGTMEEVHDRIKAAI